MGRNAILLSIGFTFVCLMSGLNLSRVSVDALTNAIKYQESTVGHDIVQAGTNFACNQLFLTPNWRVGYSNVPFGGGTFSTVINTIVRGRDSSWIQVVTTATFDGKTTSTMILLQPSLFSKFAYFSNNEPNNIYWTTGDTVWGPYHSNTSIFVDGNPVFNGKTTNRNGLVRKNSSDNPQFNGGYETGVSISMPSDLNTLKGKAQQAGGGGFYLSTTNDFFLNFNANGTVTYRSGTSGAWTTTDLATFAGYNKVIVIDGGNLRIKGVLNGQVTIAALSNSTSKGMVWFDSSVAYQTNPIPGPSDDLLGIVATNDIMIADSADNNTTAGITIQASMFSLNGGFGADNYDTRPGGGSIHLLGGISQAVRNAVGTVGNPGKGFKKSYYYDNRMLVTAPPAFPSTGSYEILEWLE